MVVCSGKYKLTCCLEQLLEVGYPFIYTDVLILNIFVKFLSFPRERRATKVPLQDFHLAYSTVPYKIPHIALTEIWNSQKRRQEAVCYTGARPVSMKWRHVSLPLSTCLPPSAFREVGQLTVCSCQDCIVRPPLRCSPPPSLPLFQRRVPLPLESWALRIQPFSSTSRCAIRIKRWLAPSAVCWIPQSGREWERRAFKSLRCRAGRAASQRKSDAY